MLSRDALGLKQMLEDTEFRRLVMQEVANGQPEPGMRAIRLVTTMLVRKGISRDKGELYANCYIIGFFFGVGVLKMKGEEGG